MAIGVSAPEDLGMQFPDGSEVDTGNAVKEETLRLPVTLEEQHRFMASLIEGYQAKLHSYLAFILPTDRYRQDREDVIQETWIKVLNALPKLKEENGDIFKRAIWSYVYTIAHNVLIDFIRHTKRHQDAISIEQKMESSPFELQDRRATLALEMVVKSESLKFALNSLTPEQRQVIMLRFVDELSIADTAKIMGKSEDAVKKLQSRAQDTLKRIRNR